MVKKVDVVVVGAGISGLVAATRLTEAGYSLVVLEARDRVGGRTYSKNFGEATFDVGGQWIGPKQKRMQGLVQELRLHTFPTYSSGKSVLDMDGKRTTYEGTIPRISPWKLGVMQRAAWAVDRLSRRVDIADPSHDASGEKFDSITLAAWAKRNLPSKAARQILDSGLRVVFGAESTEVSMLWALNYIRQSGGIMSLLETKGGSQDARFVDGAQSVAIALADRLGEHVVLGAPVRAITQLPADTGTDSVADPGRGPNESSQGLDSFGVHIESDPVFEASSTPQDSVRGLDRGSGMVEVNSESGCWHARRVIVAIPPAMASEIAYTPDLPPERAQLTQRMPMGATTKCLAIYDRAFWREKGLSGEAVMTTGPISVTYDNSSHDDSVSALVGFCVGQAARDHARLTESERRATILAAFAQCFGPEALTPDSYHEHDWQAERWTRGCPTGNFGPGAFIPFAEALSRPFARVHWAGTETASEFCGFMEGAAESGERAAIEVDEALAQNQAPKHVGTDDKEQDPTPGQSDGSDQ